MRALDVERAQLDESIEHRVVGIPEIYSIRHNANSSMMTRYRRREPPLTETPGPLRATQPR
jgi:hypothetical protein